MISDLINSQFSGCWQIRIFKKKKNIRINLGIMYFNDLNLNTDKRGYLKIEDTDVQTAIERYNSERFVKARSSIRVIFLSWKRKLSLNIFFFLQIRECASNVLTARIKIYLSIRFDCLFWLVNWMLFSEMIIIYRI